MTNSKAIFTQISMLLLLTKVYMPYKKRLPACSSLFPLKMSYNLTRIRRIVGKTIRGQKIFPKRGRYEQLKNLDILSVGQLKIGKQIMKQHKVIICGIMRDVAMELPWVIKYVEMTGYLFKDYRVVVFENDSKDKTKLILTAWALQNPRVTYLTKNYNLPRRPSMKFLTLSRNMYLREINNNPEYDGSFDIVMILDFDALFGWDIRGIYHTFSIYNEWDVVCANGITNPQGGMHDTFAFRDKNFNVSPISHRNYFKDGLWDCP